MTNIQYGVVGDVNKTIASDSEILILGSSRAKHHYSPILLEDYFQQSVYNMGVNGQGIEFSRAMLLTYLERNNLNRVILDISPNVFLTPTDDSKLMSIIPLIDIYPHFKGMFEPGDIAIELADQIDLANYNSTLYNIVRDFLSKSSKSTFKGYEGLEGNMLTSCGNITVPSMENTQADVRKVQALKDFIVICQEAQIELHIVISPIFCPTEEIQMLLDTIDRMEGSFHVHNFAIVKGLSGIQHQFKDFYHLNSRGAEAYTKLFIKDIIK
jgi:hypothetical protein